MYRLREKPIKYRLHEDCPVKTPIATLVDDHGAIAHIDVDDHCLVLVRMQKNGFGKWATHWFREALDVVKTLPFPIPDGFREE
jgi:hypothetical protein